MYKIEKKYKITGKKSFESAILAKKNWVGWVMESIPILFWPKGSSKINFVMGNVLWTVRGRFNNQRGAYSMKKMENLKNC